ncbi:MAG: phage tail tube protein [Gemmatales bacterium]|nr:hypothetical protein [Gemmatales bacterium]MDW8174670.1 phage tail tube protein [Gemmatales bacterium]
MPLPWEGAAVSGLVSGKIKRFNGSYQSVPRIDITGLDDNTRVYTPGLTDWGEFTVEIVGGSSANLSALPAPNVGATGNVTITLHQGRQIQFFGVVSGYDPTVSVGEAPSVSVKISVLGPPQSS